MSIKEVNNEVNDDTLKRAIREIDTICRIAGYKLDAENPTITIEYEYLVHFWDITNEFDEKILKALKDYFKKERSIELTVVKEIVDGCYFGKLVLKKL